MLQSVSEALKRLGLWEPHGWSQLDHDYSRLSLLSRVDPWSLRHKTQLRDQITARKLHGMLQSFSEALNGLGLWEPHGWSHLDHDSLFGQVGLVTPLSLERSCCFGTFCSLDLRLLVGHFLLLDHLVTSVSLELGPC